MEHERSSPSVLRIVALLGGGVIVIAIALGVVLGRTDREASPGSEHGTARPGSSRAPADPYLRLAAARRHEAEARRAWEGAATIAPSESSVDRSGDRVRRFQGFGIAVDSEPTRADVVVNGRDVGQTPLVASVDCRPGDRIEVEVRRSPHPAQHRVTTCRSDTLVEWSIHLRQ